jgi:signal transduction histidine kinase
MPGTEPQRLQILLVEDDVDDVMLCRVAIARSDLRCALHIAGSLGEAIERLDHDGADVALVDLYLPDAQQLDVVTALSRRFAELPIVVLTGLSDEHAAIGALQAGAEDYLVKGPGSHEMIGRAVRYAIERKRGEQARRARDAAEAENQAKNVFISQMSHELRTPLNAILGFAQLLEADSTGHSREFAGHIVTAGRHLHGLIDEVLDYARVAAGEIGLSLQPVDLAGMLDEAVTLIRPLAAERNVSVTADLATAVQVAVVADRQRLSQVLLNLLSNAVKYNAPSGVVTVSCTPQHSRIRIEIADTGPGLSPEQLANMFVPFNRLGAERGGVEGTGLGLVITKRLVEAMGATIGFDSTPGVGTTAWISWPTAVALDEAQSAPQPGRPTQHRTDATVLGK